MHARLLEEAYDVYCTRCEAGETVDKESFCRAHPAIHSSLARMIDAHRYLEERPELLDDAVQSSALAPTWPEVGQTFGGFYLARELGRGAFARVYLAQEKALGDRLVAVKVTRLEGCEAATLGPVQHPNIVPIYSVQREAEATLVCMPYRGSATLHHVFDRVHGPRGVAATAMLLEACRDDVLPDVKPPRRLEHAAYLDAVRLLAAQLAEALAYLHERGTCHRDLKPSNILVQPDGTPLLLDFNLSSNSAAPNPKMGGTPTYMAPEQLRAIHDRDGAQLDGRADVFALGVILHEWLAGEHPFGALPSALPLEELAKAQLERHERGPTPVAEALDGSLRRLVARCLALEPAQRPMAAQVARELRGQLKPHRRATRQLARHPRKTMAAVAACAALFVAALAYLVTLPAADVRAYKRGKEAYREQRHTDALEHFSAAIAAKSSEAAYWQARARTYQQLGEADEEKLSLAAADYDVADKILPDPRNAAGQGYCWQRLKQARLTEACYQKALANGYESAALQSNLGSYYTDKNQLEQARACCERALALEPSFALAHGNLATVHLHCAMPLAQRKQKAAAQDVAFQEHMGLAKQHIEQALKSSRSPSLGLLCEAARIFAFSARFDPNDVPGAVEMCERAVARGLSAAAMQQDSYYGHLRAEPRFMALTNSGATALPRLQRLADPIAEGL